MPTYEYACRDCGHHIEVVQKFTDAPLQTCERCQGSLRKVFSAAGIIFKGSGYYVTDTRSGNGKSAAARSNGASSDSASSDTSSGTSSDTSGSGTSDTAGSDSGSTSGSESKSA
jgi:putative FmdB family regulatory protein